MKNKTTIARHAMRLALALALLSTLIPQLSTVFAQGTAITYQGRLTDGTNVANGNFDLTFSIWTAASGPTQIGSTQTNVVVSNGLFTVALDFGSGIFTGSARWLEIGVRTNGSAGAYTPLNPRQLLSAAPYAVMAGNAGNLGGQSSTAFVAKAGDTMTGPLNLPANGLAVGASQLVLTGGGVGIGTTSPYGNLDVHGIFGLFGAGLSGSAYQRFDLRAGATDGLLFSAPINGAGNKLPYHFNWTGGGADTMTILGNGNVGIGAPNPQALLEIASGFGNPLIRFGHSGADYHYISAWYSSTPEINSLTFNIDNANGGASPVMSLRGDGSALVQASNTVDGAVLELRNNAPDLNENIGTITFTTADGASTKGKISCSVDGGFLFTGGTVSVPVLQINGADVAEPFELSTKDIPKGSVVTIDEENTGQLKLSDRAYDTRVAGILSGANGINSGIRLKQQGFNDHGENVALSGRVYAQADASFGAIKPGDLLTTSDTPGHCMKVTDHARAQGAIIGKAMSALEEGKGMVLVLVSLQ